MKATATIRRRFATFAVALASTLGMLVGQSSAAHADGGLPDCVHGVSYRGYTAISTSLPVNNAATSGMVERQWLYRWDGHNWRYTNRSIGVRSYSGTWMSGGIMVNSMDFFVRTGSGSYLVYEQIVQANGQRVSFWQPYYRNLPGNRWGKWCDA